MNANVSKTNGVKLLAVVAVLAMVVCAFAAVMPAEETEAAAGDTQYYSGTLDKYQSFSDGTNVIIDKPLTITTNGFLAIEGANITINEGVTVTIEKGGIFYLSAGDTTNATVATVNGSIVVKSGSYLYNAATVQTIDGKSVGGMALNGSIEVQRGGVVDNNTFTAGTSTAAGTDNATPGVVTVAASGSIKSLGTKTTPSIFNDQKISMAVGATVDLTSKIKGVTVDANVGTGVYTYGSVKIDMNTAATGGQTSEKQDAIVQEITNVSFSVTSEKIADAYYNGKAYTRAVANILDLSGSLGAYTDATIDAGELVDTKGTVDAIYMKAYDNDAASDVLIKGTVAITDSFKVNANTSVDVKQGATVNVSGSVDVAGTTGTDAATAKITAAGIINVSGQLTIDSVKTTTNADGTVELTLTGSYVNVIGEGVVSIEDYALDTASWSNAPAGTNGVTYTNDNVFYITNLAKAVEGALADKGDDTVSIWGYKAATGKVITTPYVIDTTYDIPADLTVNINGYVIIAEGATVTIPEDATFTTEVGAAGELVVEGELMDYTMAADDEEYKLTADVRTIDADETYYLYTSLKAALADANEGDTVQIYGNNKDATVTVDIEGNVAIKSGVTVDADGNVVNVKNNAVLTIDGVLDLTTAGSNIKLAAQTASSSAGAVVLNNMILISDIDTFTTVIPGFYVTGTIGDYDAATEYIMAPAVAAANSATLSSVEVKGNVSYNGDLTFTAGEDNEGTDINITGEKVSISKIIIDGYTVSMADEGIEFTGTIEATTTAGVSSVTFNKVANYDLAVYTDDSGETTVTTLQLGKVTGANTVPGNVTISAGTVELVESIGVGADRNNTLTVASGATLVVSEGVQLVIYKSTEAANIEFSAITVDGTLAMDNSNGFGPKDAGAMPVTINGTMTVVGNLTIGANLEIVVNGTLAVSEVEDEKGTLTVNGGTLTVGSAPETLGVGGAVTGPVTISDGKYITVYAGASIEAEKLNADPATGESSAVATEFFINGALYKTVYAEGDVGMQSVLPKTGTTITGYDLKDINTLTKWYTDADFKNAIKTTPNVGDEGYEAIYFNAPALNTKVQFSIGTGISLFVDGVRVTSGEYDMMSVGTHTVTATVNPGYTGDVTITFNGQTVTGTFEVTPEMADQYKADPTNYSVVLSVTGNIAVDSGASGSSDGMGLTEILLIILVVLIVVMAIMVALRLMRS